MRFVPNRYGEIRQFIVNISRRFDSFCTHIFVHRMVEVTKNHPNVFWLTGLSDSGKSTLCGMLVDYLRDKGIVVIKLDGDEIRAIVGSIRAHKRSDRLDLALRYSKLCKLLADQGFNVAIATISMFKEVHEWNRKNLPGYCEIYLNVPMDELKRRDSKGIYEKAAKNEIVNVAGLDLKVDIPTNPHITIHFEEGKDKNDTFKELILGFSKIGIEIP
jgi:adenylylsulfate kinase-like enzyme